MGPGKASVANVSAAMADMEVLSIVLRSWRIRLMMIVGRCTIVMPAAPLDEYHASTCCCALWSFCLTGRSTRIFSHFSKERLPRLAVCSHVKTFNEKNSANLPGRPWAKMATYNAVLRKA